MGQGAGQNLFSTLFKKLRGSGLHAFNWIENSLNRTLGEKYNFFYFLGAIPILLLFVLLFTGLYTFIYYSMAVDQTYESMRYMTEKAFLGGFMRGLHRYAADAMMFFVILHMVRLFVEGKFRNYRWLAWFTGVIIVFVMLVQGISGYMMPLDSTSRLVLDRTSELLASLQVVGKTLPRSFSTPSLMGKWIMWVLMIVHLFIPLSFVLLIFIHVKRISRAKIFPPIIFSVAFIAALSLFTLLFPIKMAGPADGRFLPFLEQMDWFYLFLTSLFGANPWIIIGGMLLSLGLLASFPWIGKKPEIKHAVLDLPKCTGCSLCSQDCPYEAIRMQPRTDGQNYKQEALVNADVCSGCGICVGSCDFDGMSFLDRSNDSIEEEMRQALEKSPNKWLLVICGGLVGDLDQAQLKSPAPILSVPCSGTIGPAFVRIASSLGAKGLVIGNCPEGDCHYREGNIWLQSRIRNTRKPNFKRVDAELPIAMLRFNRSHLDLFFQESGEYMQEQGAEIKEGLSRKALRYFSYLKTGSPFLHYSVTTLVLALLGWGFYMGAAAQGNYLPLDKSRFLLRVDFFHQALKRSCDTSAIDPAEYKKATERIARSVKLESLNPEARERILKQARDNVKEKFCSRDRYPLEVSILLDGKEIEKKVFKPAGVHNDGLTYALFKKYFKPGKYNLTVLAKETDGKTVAREFRYDLSQEFEGGRVYLMDLDKIKQKLFMRIP